MLRALDAAKYLAISTKQLRLLVRRGELRTIPGIGLRSPWLFDLRDLDEWVERNKTTVPEDGRRKARRMTRVA